VTSQLRETNLTENIGPPGQAGVGCGADNTTLEKTLVTKSEEAIAGYFSWQKLLRKARAYVWMSSQSMMMAMIEPIVCLRLMYSYAVWLHILSRP
jgi:hypothetical protein